jgi:hypothetical protein
MAPTDVKSGWQEILKENIQQLSLLRKLKFAI